MKAKWLNIFLIAIPLAVGADVLNHQGSSAGQLTNWIFAFALVSLIPLATLIGQLTDRLAEYFGDRVGGLLGASFGNAPELAIGVFLLLHASAHSAQSATLHSDFDVIRGLLIGSVINNVLFVLGSSVFLAALRHGRMTFSADSAASYASMLALAVVGLALPTLATNLTSHADLSSQAAVSIPFAIILILSYVAYLAATVFGVGTHPRQAVAEASATRKQDALVVAEGIPLLADDPAHATLLEKEIASEQDRDELDRKKRREYRRQHPYDVAIAMVALSVVTLLTVVIAGILVSVTDNVIQNTPLTPLSVGLILFPIVCNLGEWAGSVIAAWHNHMEGAMSVAAGSSVQVALFVTPILVLLSFPLSGGTQPLLLTLIFKPLELIVLGLVSFVYALVSLDGETTWLEGLQLLAFYAMVVAVAFALPG